MTISVGGVQARRAEIDEERSPADIYGELFAAVQRAHVLPDGKTFADAIPKRPPPAILADYTTTRPTDRAALTAFVQANFDLPKDEATQPAGPKLTLIAHLAALWPRLVRPPLTRVAGSSALPVPKPYVVPGGRFREIYYWDSYFTLLGLDRDGHANVVENMIDNFTILIERYGHVPNGTRTYYLSRSQPPFYYLMLDLSHVRTRAVLQRRLDALRLEHAFWMKGEGSVRAGGASRHVLRLKDGALLNRYWDARDTPRDESFDEDERTARGSGRPARQVYRDLRSAAESGWDFSSRWLADGRTLTTIETTDIVPIDLNSLLFGMERSIAARCTALGDRACGSAWKRDPGSGVIGVEKGPLIPVV